MLPNAINENLPYLKSVLITGNKMLFSDKIEVLSSEELGRTPPPLPRNPLLAKESVHLCPARSLLLFLEQKNPSLLRIAYF